MNTTIVLLSVICIAQTVSMVVLIVYFYKTIIDLVSIEKAKNISEVIDARREFVFPSAGEDDEEISEVVELDDIPSNL